MLYIYMLNIAFHYLAQMFTHLIDWLQSLVTKYVSYNLFDNINSIFKCFYLIYTHTIITFIINTECAIFISMLR